MSTVHDVLTYSTSYHNKLLLELVLDMTCSGSRYVLIEFLKDNHEISVIFEESYDESSKLFKLAMRTTNAIGTPYKIVLQGKNSTISYTGQLPGIEKKDLLTYNESLQVHQAQMEKFSQYEGTEAVYKVLVSLE